MINAITQRQVATFHAAVIGLVPPASATDVITITGADDKRVRVIRLGLSGKLTTGTNTTIVFVRRSTANTGGTSTSPTAVYVGPGSVVVAKAVVRAYTANPTLGTLIGNTHAVELALTSNVAVDRVYDLTHLLSNGLCLDTAADVFSVNLNGATLTGPNFTAHLHWTEEDKV